MSIVLPNSEDSAIYVQPQIIHKWYIILLYENHMIILFHSFIMPLDFLTSFLLLSVRSNAWFRCYFFVFVVVDRQNVKFLFMKKQFVSWHVKSFLFMKLETCSTYVNSKKYVMTCHFIKINIFELLTLE